MPYGGDIRKRRAEGGLELSGHILLAQHSESRSSRQQLFTTHEALRVTLFLTNQC